MNNFRKCVQKHTNKKSLYIVNFYTVYYNENNKKINTVIRKYYHVFRWFSKNRKEREI
jgi:hypothetical protein